MCSYTHSSRSQSVVLFRVGQRERRSRPELHRQGPHSAVVSYPESRSTANARAPVLTLRGASAFPETARTALEPSFNSAYARF